MPAPHPDLSSLSTLQDFEVFADFLQVYSQKNRSHACPVGQLGGVQQVKLHGFWHIEQGSLSLHPRRPRFTMDLRFVLQDESILLQDGTVSFQATQDPEVVLVGEKVLLRRNERGCWLEKHS